MTGGSERANYLEEYLILIKMVILVIWIITVGTIVLVLM